jgi:hypothetical protein
MNFWPFRTKPKKPRYTVNLHKAAARDVAVAAAWTVYGGTIALIRTGDYAADHPEAAGHDSPFDEECYARDAMAEFWQVAAEKKDATEPYLDLLATIRAAGFMREYVWAFLRADSWIQPQNLKLGEFDEWRTAKGLQDHQPQTMAFVTAV